MTHQPESPQPPVRKMSRRNFLAGGAAAATAVSLGTVLTGTQEAPPAARPATFKLNYAPHLYYDWIDDPPGMFGQHAGKDPVDQLKFIADEGFTAIEDNDMASRSKGEQERRAREMTRLGLTMGVFVAYGDFGVKSFVTDDRDMRDMLVGKMKAAVEVAKRVNARWTTLVLGAYDDGLEWDYQTANVIENLKWCAEVLEPAGLIAVLESLNPRNHLGLFLTKIPQAYQICRAVGSPSVKILNDLWHQQITEGNLIPNIDLAWEEIAYIQVGDHPGRNEPGTGEINFRNIFKHLHAKGYQGIIGMEHGNSTKGKAGERAVIDAYIAADNF